MNEQQWDVVVVGGGPAGLSAALTLVRARRRVLVVDGGRPRNRFTTHMHAVLGRDGTPPTALLSAGRTEIERYGGVVRAGTVTDVERTEEGFLIALDQDRVRARRLMVATGASDQLPELEGLAEFWGNGVAVCPYCDAYEFRDERIGILATGPGSPFQAQQLRQWTDSVVYLADAVGAPTDDERAGFDARGIELVQGPVQRVLSSQGRLSGVEMADGRQIALSAIFTIPELQPADGVLSRLGAQTAQGPAGPFAQIDATGQPSVPGVWAAGNVVNPFASVPISIGAGALAAGSINHDLIQDDIALALAERGEHT